MLDQQPPWHAPEQQLTLPDMCVLHDQGSGFVAEPGEFTIIVSALPDDSAALADRLGRYLPAPHEPVPLTSRRASKAVPYAARESTSEWNEPSWQSETGGLPGRSGV